MAKAGDGNKAQADKQQAGMSHSVGGTRIRASQGRIAQGNQFQSVGNFTGGDRQTSNATKISNCQISIVLPPSALVAKGKKGVALRGGKGLVPHLQSLSLLGTEGSSGEEEASGQDTEGEGGDESADEDEDGVNEDSDADQQEDSDEEEGEVDDSENEESDDGAEDSDGNDNGEQEDDDDDDDGEGDEEEEGEEEGEEEEEEEEVIAEVLGDTRKDQIGALEDWVWSDGSPPVHFVYGSWGSGKTAVLKSFTQTVDTMNRNGCRETTLVSYYECGSSWSDNDSGGTKTHLAKTCARDLVTRLESRVAAFADLQLLGQSAKRRPGEVLGVERAWRKHVIPWAQSLDADDPDGPRYLICLDGLSHLERTGIKPLLRLLDSLIKAANGRVRLLISSLHSASVQKVMERTFCGHCVSMTLGPYPASEVSAFLKSRLWSIMSEAGVRTSLKDEHVRYLRQFTKNSFFWAARILDHLEEHEHPDQVLAIWMFSSSSKSQNGRLKWTNPRSEQVKMYEAIIEAIVADRPDRKQILAVLCYAAYMVDDIDWDIVAIAADCEPSQVREYVDLLSPFISRLETGDRLCDNVVAHLFTGSAQFSKYLPLSSVDVHKKIVRACGVEVGRLLENTSQLASTVEIVAELNQPVYPGSRYAWRNMHHHYQQAGVTGNPHQKSLMPNFQHTLMQLVSDVEIQADIEAGWASDNKWGISPEIWLLIVAFDKMGAFSASPEVAASIVMMWLSSTRLASHFGRLATPSGILTSMSTVGSLPSGSTDGLPAVHAAYRRLFPMTVLPDSKQDAAESPVRKVWSKTVDDYVIEYTEAGPADDEQLTVTAQVDGCEEAAKTVLSPTSLCRVDRLVFSPADWKTVSFGSRIVSIRRTEAASDPSDGFVGSFWSMPIPFGTGITHAEIVQRVKGVVCYNPVPRAVSLWRLSPDPICLVTMPIPDPLKLAGECAEIKLSPDETKAGFLFSIVDADGKPKNMTAAVLDLETQQWAFIVPRETIAASFFFSPRSDQLFVHQVSVDGRHERIERWEIGDDPAVVDSSVYMWDFSQGVCSAITDDATHFLSRPSLPFHMGKLSSLLEWPAVIVQVDPGEVWYHGKLYEQSPSGLRPQKALFSADHEWMALWMNKCRSCVLVRIGPDGKTPDWHIGHEKWISPGRPRAFTSNPPLLIVEAEDEISALNLHNGEVSELMKLPFCSTDDRTFVNLESRLLIVDSAGWAVLTHLTPSGSPVFIPDVADVVTVRHGKCMIVIHNQPASYSLWDIESATMLDSIEPSDAADVTIPTSVTNIEAVWKTLKGAKQVEDELAATSDGQACRSTISACGTIMGTAFVGTTRYTISQSNAMSDTDHVELPTEAEMDCLALSSVSRRGAFVRRGPVSEEGETVIFFASLESGDLPSEQSSTVRIASPAEGTDIKAVFSPRDQLAAIWTDDEVYLVNLSDSQAGLAADQLSIRHPRLVWFDDDSRLWIATTERVVTTGGYADRLALSIGPVFFPGNLELLLKSPSLLASVVAATIPAAAKQDQARPILTPAGLSFKSGVLPLLQQPTACRRVDHMLVSDFYVAGDMTFWLNTVGEIVEIPWTDELAAWIAPS